MDWTLLIAALGAVTGTVALVVTVLTYRRDRARLVVKCDNGVVFNATWTSGPMLIIDAVNAGRRPIRVESAGFIAEKAPEEHLTTFGDFQTFPKTLSEGEKVSVQVKLESVYEQSIGAGKGRPTVAFYKDSLGHLHKAKVPAAVLTRLTAMGAGDPGQSSPSA
jgi:hypothetical protein